MREEDVDDEDEGVLDFLMIWESLWIFNEGEHKALLLLLLLVVICVGLIAMFGAYDLWGWLNMEAAVEEEGMMCIYSVCVDMCTSKVHLIFS